jgi:hypothetical protein
VPWPCHGGPRCGRPGGERYPYWLPDGARETTSADALRKLYKQPIVGDVQSLRRDPHEREATCAMHLDDYCLSTLPPDPLDVPR